jgi:hypothetical protein
VGLLAAVARVGVEALLVLVATEVVVMAAKTAVKVAVTSHEAKVQRAWMLRLRSNAPLAQRASATASVAAPAVEQASSPGSSAGELKL